MNCKWWFEFLRVKRTKTKRSDKIEQKTKQAEKLKSCEMKEG